MPENRIKNMFAAIARHYDFLNSLLSLRFDKMWRRETVEASRVASTSKVLDVCTGTGELALAYADKIGDNGSVIGDNGSVIGDKGSVIGDKGSVIGSDFCFEMLSIGKQKVVSQSELAPTVPVTRFIAADTLMLPFFDNTFDIVSVGFGIRNVTNLEEGIREMTRVAVPGGRIVILEFTQPRNLVFQRLYYFYFTKILPFIGNLISGSKDDAYGYLPRSVMRFPNCDALKEVMEQCGLTDVRFHRKTLGVIAIHVGKKTSRD